MRSWVQRGWTGFGFGGLAFAVILVGSGCSKEPRQVARPSGPGATTATAVAPSQSAPPPVQSRQPQADPNFSPGWAKSLPKGFVYFNDSLGKHGQAPIEATVVPASSGARFYLSGDKKTTYWTPTLADVFKLNAARDLVEQKEPRIAKRTLDYRYQVVGVDDGTKRVFVNAFCSEHPVQRTARCRYAFSQDKSGDWVEWPAGACPEQRWLYEPVWVKDGGACYFNFKYNPKTGAIFDLVVNGEA